MIAGRYSMKDIEQIRISANSAIKEDLIQWNLSYSSHVISSAQVRHVLEALSKFHADRGEQIAIVNPPVERAPFEIEVDPSDV